MPTTSTPEDDSSPIAKSPQRVGTWDLGAWVGHLRTIYEELNQAQSLFRFEMTKSATPVGLLYGGWRLLLSGEDEADLPGHPQEGSSILQWLRNTVSGAALSRRALEHNIIVNDLLPYAEKLRKRERLGYLVVLTPQMLAGVDEEGPFASHFGWSEGKILFVSTYEVPEFARQGGRTLEAAVASMVVSQLLAVKFAKLEFHEETRGCLFDYNDDRKSIARGFRRMAIDDECLDKIPKVRRPEIEGMLRILRSYKRGSSRSAADT